jgi:hypothetical protein
VITSGLLDGCTKLALREQHRVILEPLVRALRLHGGEDGFDALLQVARSAESIFARDAATRALAWVPRYPQRAARLNELGRSRDRSTFRVVSKALAEARNHGLFSREGEFASDEERALREALERYLRALDPDAERELDDAFRTGRLRLEVERPASVDGRRKVSLITPDDVPILTEEARVRELLGRLGRLSSLELSGDRMSDEELEAERILRRTFPEDEDLKFRDEDRLNLARAIRRAPRDMMPTVLQMANTFWAQGESESPSRFLITDPLTDDQFDVLVLLLRALPRYAHAVRFVFLKGETGTPERIAQTREVCPNLEHYWGYAGAYPENASAHMERWIELCNDPGRYERSGLDGLSGTEAVVLWSRDRGMMAAG